MDVTRSHPITRRDYLKYAAGSVLASKALDRAAWACDDARDNPPVEPKSVAAVITAYQKGWHADVLIGKILEGWEQDGGKGPALKLASMYVDQFTDKDLARGMSKKYGVPIFDTIEQALTLGGDGVAVDGVISVGEHGDYPWNEKEQHLYPRRRFFEGITDTFAKYDCVVPVFSDKHLGPQWADAQWMYDRARELNVPFMAGSSLPLSYRKPEIDLPLGCDIEAVVGVGYSGLDIYGAHALDCFQSLVERRRGGEVGVKWVQCLEGDAMWQAIDDGAIDRDLMTAALAVVPRQNDDPRAGKQTALFLFEYLDGLKGAVLKLPEHAAGTAVSLKLKGNTEPVATHFEERLEPGLPHFAYLLKAIERMMHSGEPSYPVERTLLSSGMLDRLLTSRIQNHEKLTTPELAIAYQPADYPHAPHPELTSSPRSPIPS
ncbi:MAG: hypothetical protein WEB58_00445 [Planctomycetaceae bacterium]